MMKVLLRAKEKEEFWLFGGLFRVEYDLDTYANFMTNTKEVVVNI